jgi:hypothetical protein
MCRQEQEQDVLALPTIHIFTGDYGPFKSWGRVAFEDALMLLMATNKDDDKNTENDRGHCEKDGGSFVVIIQCTRFFPIQISW